MDFPITVSVGVLLLILVSSTQSDSVEQTKAPQAFLVSGVQLEILPDPIFYDTYIPLFYEINLPNWKLDDFQLKWPSEYSTVTHPSACTESDFWGDNWNQMACPVTHHLNQFITQFFQRSQDWKKTISLMKSTPVELYYCDKIQRHFKSLTLGNLEKSEYLKKDLKNCLTGLVVYENLHEKLSIINSSIYDTMLSRFMEENVSKDKYRVTGFNRYPAATNAFVAIQNLKMMDYAHTDLKWSESIMNCNVNQRIPPALISSSILNASLHKIKRVLNYKDDFELAVGADSNLSNYYRLPLADCVFTTNGTYLMRILVPLKKKNKGNHHKLATVRTIPFLRNYGNSPEICEYSLETEMNGKTTEINVIIEGSINSTIGSGDKSTVFAIDNCKPGELCFVPNISSRPFKNYCLLALMKNNTNEIIRHCEDERHNFMKCRNIQLEDLPYFRRLATDTYAVLGKSDLEIFISCGNQPFKVVCPPMIIGSLQITLPCNCQIVYRGEILNSMTPCANDLILSEILPVIWSSHGATQLSYIGSHNHEAKANESSGSGNDSKVYILLTLVIILICFSVGLGLVILKMHDRVCKLEDLGNTRNQNHQEYNLYETPIHFMNVRASDD